MKNWVQNGVVIEVSRGTRWLGATLAFTAVVGCGKPTEKAATAPAVPTAAVAPPAVAPSAAPTTTTANEQAPKYDLISGASPKLGDVPLPRLNAPKLAVPKGGEQWAAEFANTPAVGELGGPRAGLTDQELIDFVRGRVAFRDGPTEAGGLGPKFIQKACGECHSHPFIGGEGDMDHALTVGIRPGEVEVVFVHEKAIPGFEPDAVPKGMILAKSRAPMLLGVGLMDKIPAEVIAKNADPDDANHDGIHGQVNMRDNTVARWGLKSQDLTLHRLIVGSLVADLGLTVEEMKDAQKDADKVADPEASKELIHLYEAFLGNLAPAPRALITDAARAGEKEFALAGCAACHIPDLGEAKGMYSDLLIHDMGVEDDNKMPDVKARGQDWRTAQLWGLRLRKAFFHDHRAKDYDQAIDMHRGESDKSRLAAQSLPGDRRKQLMAFLASL